MDFVLGGNYAGMKLILIAIVLVGIAIALLPLPSVGRIAAGALVSVFAIAGLVIQQSAPGRTDWPA